MWHYPLTILNAAVVGWTWPGRLGVAVVTTTTSVALAAWSYRFVERPLRDQAYGPLTTAPLRDSLQRLLGRRPPIRTTVDAKTRAAI